MKHMVIVAVILCMGSVALWGCDEEGDEVICKPGETRVCQCSTGGVGIEGCSSDGTAWSPCYCTGDGDIDTDVVDQIDTPDTVDTTDDIDTDPADTVDTVDTGVCNDGDKQCQDTAVYACLNNSWSFILDCASSGQLCQNGECVAAPDGDEDPVDTGDCSNGAVRCIGNIVFVCQSGDWQQQEDCGDSYRVCSEGICTCTAGEKKCDADNLQTCISNSWQTTTNCAQQDETCYEGACACRNDSYRCLGTVRQYCYNHDWNYDTYDCAEDDYVCYEGDCVVCYGDMKKCEGDYVYFCEIDDYWGNNWEYEQDCSDEGKVCENGACVNAP